MALKCFGEAFQCIRPLLGCSPGQQGLEQAPMIAPFIAAAALLVAMINAALFNSAPHEGTDEERSQLMEELTGRTSDHPDSR